MCSSYSLLQATCEIWWCARHCKAQAMLSPDSIEILNCLGLHLADSACLKIMAAAPAQRTICLLQAQETRPSTTGCKPC